MSEINIYTLDRFTDAYIECALWSSTDESDETGGRPMDDNYSIADIAQETLARMVEDCRAFQEEAQTLIDASGLSQEQARP